MINPPWGVVCADLAAVRAESRKSPVTSFALASKETDYVPHSSASEFALRQDAWPPARAALGQQESLSGRGN